MKMEIPIISDTTGIVESMLVEEGDTVNEDQIVIIIK